MQNLHFFLQIPLFSLIFCYFSRFLLPKSLSFFKISILFYRYFGIAYPLAKYDMVAVPNFPFSGMENWGLVTYMEVSMLLPDTADALTREKVKVKKIKMKK